MTTLPTIFGLKVPRWLIIGLAQAKCLSEKHWESTGKCLELHCVRREWNENVVLYCTTIAVMIQLSCGNMQHLPTRKNKQKTKSRCKSLSSPRKNKNVLFKYSTNERVALGNWRHSQTGSKSYWSYDALPFWFQNQCFAHLRPYQSRRLALLH